jgi:hypothetical protein
MAQLTLNWNANPADELIAAYRVYKDDAMVQEVPGTSAVIDGVGPGQYKIEVSAINEKGEGPKSDPVIATVELQPPSKPTGLTVVVTVNVTVNVNVNPQ